MVDEGEVEMVWFATPVVLLRFRSESGGEESEAVFVQNTEVITLLNVVEKNLTFICVRQSASDEMDHSICYKKLEHRVVKVGELYGLESLQSIMGRAHRERLNPAGLVYYKSAIFPLSVSC